MLLKRGAHLRNRWRPRYFVTDRVSHHVNYYVDREAYDKKPDKPKGSIRLPGAILTREKTVKSPSLASVIAAGGGEVTADGHAVATGLKDKRGNLAAEKKSSSAAAVSGAGGKGNKPSLEKTQTFAFSVKPLGSKQIVMLSADTATARDSWLAAFRREGAIDPKLDEEDRLARISTARKATIAQQRESVASNSGDGAAGVAGSATLGRPAAASLRPSVLAGRGVGAGVNRSARHPNGGDVRPGSSRGKSSVRSMGQAAGDDLPSTGKSWWQQSLRVPEPVANSDLASDLAPPLKAALKQIETGMEHLRTALLEKTCQTTATSGVKQSTMLAGYVEAKAQRQVGQCIERMVAQYCRISPGSCRLREPVNFHWWLQEGVSREYWPVLSLMFEPGFSRVLRICSRIRSAENLEEVSRALVEVGEVTGSTIPLFSAVINHHVKEAASEATLFRVNSVASKMFGHISRMDRLFLPRVLARVTRKIVQSTVQAGLSFEIDETKLKRTIASAAAQSKSGASKEERAATLKQQLKMNTASLEVFAGLYFDRILASIHHAPMRLRLLCHSLLHAVSQRFEPANAYRSVSAFIFLRLFVPALSTVGVSKDRWEGTDIIAATVGRAGSPDEEAALRAAAESAPAVRRNFLLIAKVLQCFANGVKFGAKEPYMIPLNKLLDKYQPRLRKFCVEFASPFGMELYVPFIPRTRNALAAKVAGADPSFRILKALATDLEAEEALAVRAESNRRQSVSKLKKAWVDDTNIKTCPLCDRRFEASGDSGPATTERKKEEGLKGDANATQSGGQAKESMKSSAAAAESKQTSADVAAGGGWIKHRCRSCGGVYCGPCSSYRSPVPRYGFDTPVRVCDVCCERIGAVDMSVPPTVSVAGELRDSNLDLLFSMP